MLERGFNTANSTILNTPRTLEFEAPVSDIQLRFTNVHSNTRVGRFEVEYSDGTTEELTFELIDTNPRISIETFNDETVIHGANINGFQGDGTVVFTNLNPDLRISSISFEQVSRPWSIGNITFSVIPIIPGIDATRDQDEDEDGIVNHLDTDADDSGASDTVEAQHGQDIITPTGDSDGNGLDNAYELAPGEGQGLEVADDADQDGNPDFTDAVFDLTAALETALESGVLTETGDDNTIAFDAEVAEFDLRGVADIAFTNVDTIDMTDGATNTLTLALSDLVNLSADSDTLFVLGDAGDSVNAFGGFQANGTTTLQGMTYNVFTQSGANLLVEEDVTVTLF